MNERSKMLCVGIAVIGLVIMFFVSGCSIVNEKEDKDKAIEDCKNQGGTPIVKNYDDSILRPIVHCKFEKDRDKE